MIDKNKSNNYFKDREKHNFMEGHSKVGIEKNILGFAYKNKDIILKLFPIKLIRKIKLFLVKKNFKKIGKVEIKKYDMGKYPSGINIIGSIKAETGLGESCRLLAKEVSNTSYPFMIYNYSQIGQMRENDDRWDNKIEKECKYGINIIHINPNEFVVAALQLPKDIWDYRYNIGFWLWEFEEIPDQWLDCSSILNEIWTPSDFITKSLSKKFNIPIKTVPYAIQVEVDNIYDRKFFNLPEDKFLFLMMYDKNSISDRKNPKSVIDAFKEAFPKEKTEVGLVIKIGTSDKNELNEVKAYIGDYSNVYFIDEMLSKVQVNSLINIADVAVSLHRAEGFGLVLAEAMYLGKPTIGTNWSSNIEFMNKNNSCLVDYKLVELPKDNGPFRKGWKWAEPDVKNAAFYMKKLYCNKEYYNEISKNAFSDIRKTLGIDRSKLLIEKNIKEISVES